MTPPFVITIDGPGGAGKSTVAKGLAERLSCLFLDTGALYRAVAVKVLREDIPEDDEEALGALCRRTEIRIDRDPAGVRVLLDGDDVTGEIRLDRVGITASNISARPVVRQALLSLQRSAARSGCLVAEGRDMGTVVFPKADVKFFLDASPRERALRRFRELEARGTPADLASIERDLARRDRQDRQRTVAPLRPAEDAFVIDCSTLTAEEVVAEMLREIGKRRNMPPTGPIPKGSPEAHPGKVA